MTDFANDVTPPSAAHPSQVCVNANLRASFLQDMVLIAAEYNLVLNTVAVSASFPTHPAKQN